MKRNSKFNQFNIIKFILIVNFIIIIKENIKSETNKLKNTKICLCTNGKKENLYVREFVEHYIKYGVDKIFVLKFYIN